MQRALQNSIAKDVQEKIVLLSGPRQVGKTTLSKSLFNNFTYLNFDSIDDLNTLRGRDWNRNVDLVIFDELHKMKKWKSWVKGIFDTEPRPPGLLVTGSARLNMYRKGGDSLAGRHFLYRLHPFTVKELNQTHEAEEVLDLLMRVGGFPEPFLKGSEETAQRWRRGHLDVILREDLLDLEKVRDIKSMEILIDLLSRRVGSTTSYSSLARDLQVSVHTVKHWLQILENLFVIFPVRAYHKNVARSLVKEAKYYFYDTGAVKGDESAKLENVVACGLFAESNRLEDMHGCQAELYYLRDRDKREVDFLTVVNETPTHMVEVKASDDAFSKPLLYFKRNFPQAKAFQIVRELKKRKTLEGINMITVHEYLREFKISDHA